MQYIIIILFVLNAIAHLISYKNLKKEKSPNATGVFAFIFINLALAFIVWKAYSWAKWPALILPSLGALGLLVTTILKGKSTSIDFVILLLDLAIIFLLLWQFFF